MQHDAEKAERLGAIELAGHGVDGLLPQRRDRSGKVDQVARVRHDWRQATRTHLRAEFADLFGRHDAPSPLAGVLREDLKRLAAMDDRAVDRARQSSGHRHVRAEPGTTNPHRPNSSWRTRPSGPTRTTRLKIDGERGASIDDMLRTNRMSLHLTVAVPV